MYCLTNICYVCLKKKDKSLMNINSSLSVNKDIIHIIDSLPFNLGWMKTKPIILICDDCCRRFLETYQFLIMCRKNSAVLQSYMAKINISNTDNEAELRVHINNKQDDFNETKCEIKSDGEEIYTVKSEPIIDETDNVFVNIDDAFIKEEDRWKREAVDDEEEPAIEDNCTEGSDKEVVLNNKHDDISEIKCEIKLEQEEMYTIIEESGEVFVNVNNHFVKVEDNWDEEDDKEELLMKNNTTESSDNESDWEMAVNSNNTHDTDSSESASTQVHKTNKKKQLNTAANGSLKCPICNKSFTRKTHLQIHRRVHKGGRQYKCATCLKEFRDNFDLLRHERTHTGEKPYECSVCNKCFPVSGRLVAHMRSSHNEKAYKCDVCKKCFRNRNNLESHMIIHGLSSRS